MKYFYLAHNVLSYNCLKDLVERGYNPDFIVIHKNYEYDKLKKSFYIPIERLAKENKIKIRAVKSINDVKKLIVKSEIGICVGFMEIIKEDVFSLPKFGIFNLHCGKLPLYRGRAPLSRALINGEKYVTVTIHKIDEGIDSGDIYLEKEITVANNDDVNSLYNQCSLIAPRLIIEFMNKFSKGILEAKKQIINELNVANKQINSDERKIDWNKDIVEIHNLIRGLASPYPGAYSTYKNINYIINKTKILEQYTGVMVNAGMIIKVSKNFMLIKCRNGILRISGIVNENYEKVKIINIFQEKDRLL